MVSKMKRNMLKKPHCITVLIVWAECNEGFYGENCAQKCGAGCVGNCDRATGCECQDWWVEQGSCDTEVPGEDTINLITMQLNLVHTGNSECKGTMVLFECDGSDENHACTLYCVCCCTQLRGRYPEGTVTKKS